MGEGSIEDGSEVTARLAFAAAVSKDFEALLSLTGSTPGSPGGPVREILDDYGNTLLHLCCHAGFKRGVKLCVRGGCDLDGTNRYGNTPMHFAKEGGRGKIVEYLKKKGARTDLRNELGLTCYERVGVEEEIV
jgi:hypothetical protein